MCRTNDTYFCFLFLVALCSLYVYICEKSFEMNTLLFILPSGSELLIIALVVLLLFGGKKIPELMRGLGKGVRSFKDGMNDKGDNTQDSDNATKSNK